MRLVDGARVTEVSDRKGDTADALPDVNSDVRR